MAFSLNGVNIPEWNGNIILNGVAIDRLYMADEHTDMTLVWEKKLPEQIIDFEATDDLDDKIICTWTTGDYTDRVKLFADGSVIDMDATSPYDWGMAIPGQVYDMYVIADNEAGETESNHDNGKRLGPPPPPGPDWPHWVLVTAWDNPSHEPVRGTNPETITHNELDESYTFHPPKAGNYMIVLQGAGGGGGGGGSGDTTTNADCGKGGYGGKAGEYLEHYPLYLDSPTDIWCGKGGIGGVGKGDNDACDCDHGECASDIGPDGDGDYAAILGLKANGGDRGLCGYWGAPEAPGESWGKGEPGEDSTWGIGGAAPTWCSSTDGMVGTDGGGGGGAAGGEAGSCCTSDGNKGGHGGNGGYGFVYIAWRD